MKQKNLVERINFNVRIARENGTLERLEERLRPFLVAWMVIAVVTKPPPRHQGGRDC